MTTTPIRPRYRRGDVVLAVFPNSDHRGVKLRSALIIQANNLRTGPPQVVVAMISSNVARSGHPSRVMVRQATLAGRRSGLLVDSVVMTDNLMTVADPLIKRVIGSLPMADVESALRHTLAL